jgi:anti-repressor protein
MSAIKNCNNQNLESETLPQIFDFDGSQIRVIIDQKGEPWFVANEVTNILGYRMASDATRVLDIDEKGTHNLSTLGGLQKLAIINESGLYSLIFASRRKEAKIFKKWVTSDVLPAIRKTGSYGQQIDLSDTKLLHKLLLNYTDRVSKLECEVEFNQPKVNFYDNFINSEGLYNLQNAARALNCHPNLFIDSLKDHYLFYQNKVLVPYQRYRTQGLFVVKSNILDNQVRYQTYITPKGLRYFAEHSYVNQANNDNSNYQSTIINY